MWITTKEVDPYFFGGLVVSLFLFSLELLVQSCVVDDFKYGFFFWLDFIATVSLIPDISWILDYLAVLIHMDPSVYSMDVKPGIPLSTKNNSNITKVIRSFRLIRLIRIIKLYNYAVKSNAEAEEAKLREQQKMSSNAQQAALKKELEPSRLGKHLSDTLTRRLIMIILTLLMALPLLTFSGTDYTS
jgi:signal transduction histidine kinase